MSAGHACLLAAPDVAIEPGLVAGAAAHGLDVRRRPLDAADLLAVAALQPGLSIALSPGLPRLSQEIVARCSQGRRVVGLAQSDEDVQQLARLGVATVVPCTTVEQTLSALIAALDGRLDAQPPGPQPRATHAGVWATGAWDTDASDTDPSDAAAWAQPSTPGPTPTATPTEAQAGQPPAAARAPGRVIAVWGPAGAPGRTTTALLIARLLAQAGGAVCVVDADTSAPSLLEVLGVPEHASSLVVCCRLAERGSLPPTRLLQIGHQVEPGVLALGGVGQPEQWADLRPAALSRVLHICREACDVTVVDIGDGIGQQGALDLDDPAAGAVLGTPRHAAAGAVLAQADATVAVARASVLGLTRLLQRLPLLDAARASALAIALTPPAEGGTTSAALRSLREYGCTAPVFELPRLTTQQLVGHGLPRGSRRSRSALGALRSWLQDQGEGSTTTAVPTRAKR